MNFPEPIEAADIVLPVGGAGDGTPRTRNWAIMKNKLIFPVARCDGAAKQLFMMEKKRIEDTHIAKDYAICRDIRKNLISLLLN